MTCKTVANSWTKPELAKLGKIADVAPGTATSTRQGSNSRT